MTRRLILVRHGRSAHVHRGWIDAAGVETWRVAYDAAGIADDDSPPPSLSALAANALVVASDLPRAIDSAARLVPRDAVMTSPLLREVPLPIPALGGARLPLGVWGTVIGLRWLANMRAGGSSHNADARGRGLEAAAWLAALTESHPSIVVVTHGAFRRYLHDGLQRQGWTPSGERRRFSHWSTWALSRHA
jgi:broad specificity phosphatase PhoE